MQDQYDDGDMANASSKVFEVEKIIKNIFINYKFQEIRTPVLEDANLFKRSVGDSSDIVNKEIYSFNDRNNKAIAMRPEGTASVIRSIIEKKIDQTNHKLWYMGPISRGTFEIPASIAKRIHAPLRRRIFAKCAPKRVAARDRLVRQFANVWLVI